MNATYNNSDTTIKHHFQIEHEGEQYGVTVHTKENGKFLDENITRDGFELDHEGEEGQIREDIMTYLDENWDSLVKI